MLECQNFSQRRSSYLIIYDDSTKLFSDLHLFKFLATSAKSFIPLYFLPFCADCFFFFFFKVNVLIIHWLDWHEKYLGCFTREDRCAKMKNRSRIVDQVRRCASSRLDAVRIAVALRQEENLVCRLSRNYGDTVYNGGYFTYKIIVWSVTRISRFTWYPTLSLRFINFYSLRITAREINY